MTDERFNIREHLGSRILPVFFDTALETDFRNYLLASKRTLIRTSLVIALLLFVVVEPIARLWIPSEAYTLDNAFRWLFHVPLMLLLLGIFEFSKNNTFVEYSLITGIALFLLANGILNWSAGYADRQFHSIASVQIMLFGFLLLGLRFRPVFITIAASFGISFIGILLIDKHQPIVEILRSPYIMAAMIFLGLTVSAYTLDISARTVFLVELARKRAFAEKMSMERERSSWLRIGSDFLNHELKNSLLGITSSLSLIKRRNLNSVLDEYIDRAERSTTFMKRLLLDVSASTSLETSLQSISMENYDLVEIFSARVTGYKDMYPHNHFVLTGDDSLLLPCDADRITQMLDNLIANAVEHGDAKSDIKIELVATEKTALLSVSDTGDVLVDSGPNIFEPLVSGKKRTSDSGFGFGLYVVKRIAEAHGGNVTAKRLTQPDGAEFTVSLPL